jgi:hypothetical protein
VLFGLVTVMSGWPLRFDATVWGMPSRGLAVTATLARAELVLDVTVPVTLPVEAAVGVGIVGAGS